jgi:sortase A
VSYPEDDAGTATPRRTVGRQILISAIAWSLFLVAATVAVVYPLGPTLQHRRQHHLLRSFREELDHAANAKEGLAGLLDQGEVPAPAVGDPVAVLDIGAIRLRQVVVEGANSAQTSQGPGHVPGTAGLGQPGNATVVGRRSGWGGPFSDLARLRPGHRIVTTTTQGQAVYRVQTVRHVPAGRSLGAPTGDDRLTLVTSDSAWPLASGRAVVVVAKLEGQPFEPTAQGTRPQAVPGAGGDRSGIGTLGFFALVFASIAGAAAVAPRRWKPLVAHLLTTPVLVVLAVVVAEQASRLLPAWS